MAAENTITTGTERVPPPDAMSWLDAEDAEISKIPLNPTVTVTGGDPPKEPPLTEAPPVTEPPPGDVTPPVTEEPPAATPPAEVDPDADPDDLSLDTETPPATEAERRTRRPKWKDVKAADQRADDAERRFREVQSENAHLRGVLEGRATAPQATQPPVVEPKVVPDEDTDPLTAVEREVQTIKRENAEMRQTLAARDLERTVNDQERDFAAKTPDYNKALEHYIGVRRTQLTESGELDTFQAELAALPVNDPLRQHAMGLIRQGVELRGQTQAEATREAVFAIAIGAERNRLVTSALKTGKNPSEVAYKRALQSGWKVTPETATKPADEPARPVVTKPDKQLVREAATSVATLARSSTPPPDGRMTKRKLLSMDEPDMTRYIDDHDRTDPGWFDRMPES